MAKEAADPVMVRARLLFEQSGLTLEELGKRMGAAGPTARAASWQFLNRTNDPRLSTLRRFAKAVGAEVRDLFPK